MINWRLTWQRLWALEKLHCWNETKEQKTKSIWCAMRICHVFCVPIMIVKKLKKRRWRKMVTNGHQEMIIMLVDHIKYKQEEGKKKYIVTKEVKISVKGPTLTHEIKKIIPCEYSQTTLYSSWGEPNLICQKRYSVISVNDCGRFRHPATNYSKPVISCVVNSERKNADKVWLYSALSTFAG